MPHALNLKDSGVSVRVGLPGTSRSWAKAEAAGLDVAEVADVAKWADVIMVLVPRPLPRLSSTPTRSHPIWRRVKC